MVGIDCNSRPRNTPMNNTPIRNARTRNAPTGLTVTAQGNALGTNVPPKPPSPNGANVHVNHVAPLGQRIIGGGHTQGVALGYRRLCRWHIGQNDVTPIAMIHFTKIQTPSLWFGRMQSDRLRLPATISLPCLHSMESRQRWIQVFRRLHSSNSVCRLGQARCILPTS